MDLQADLKWIHQELDNVKDPTLLEAIKNMLKYRTKSNPQTIEEYNRDIELAEEDIKAGRVYTQNQIEDLREQWRGQL
jgi:SMC interacting uncharacterized protein involved in chromosome segregation